jgi:hypothetical protein
MYYKLWKTFFTANEIDDDAFELLTNETLQKLMSIGKFLKFKEKFNKYQQMKKEQAVISPPIRTNEFPSPAPKKKLKTDTNFCSNVNLTRLLETSDNGLMILNNKEELGNNHRQILCRIIVDHFISNDVTMGKIEFKKMAEKIMLEFPTESDINIYYVEPVGKSRKVKGKLAERYFNYTRLLKKHNILESRTESVSSSNEGIILLN